MYAHSHRTLSAPRAIASAALLALTLSFAGCKKAVAPPDDAALTSALQARISGDNALKTETIRASVENGIATLNGAVSSEAARSLAAADAAQVTGLKTVVNNLTVQQAAQQPAPQPAPAAVVPPPAPVRKAEKKPTPRVVPKPVKHQSAPIERIAPVQQAQNGPPPPPPQQEPPPAPAPPPPPAFRDVTVPAGSAIPIRMTQTLDSATTQEGETFSGTVATDIIIDGLVVIPQGAKVSGRVDTVQEAAHFKGNSLLTIELTRLTHHGDSFALSTEPYSVAGKGRGKNTAAKVGGGAAVGAILGGIFGGGKGAAIGAAAGGGVGAGANAVTKGEQVQIPSETLIRFRLTNALALRASTRNTRSTSANPNLQQRQADQPQSDDQPQ
jgi:outer membrane biosynthesis protein TonB